MESSSHSQKKHLRPQTMYIPTRAQTEKETYWIGIPIRSMYGIFTYIWVILFGQMMVNIPAPWSIWDRISERSIFSLRHFPTEHLPPLFSPLWRSRVAGTVARKGCKFLNLGFESSSLRDLRAPARPASLAKHHGCLTCTDWCTPKSSKISKISKSVPGNVKHSETHADLWIPNFSKPPDDSKLHDRSLLIANNI